MSAARLVILGAGGDLTGRYLLPALAELTAADCAPPSLEVVGVARHGWTDKEFRDRAASLLDRHADGLEPSRRDDLIGRLRFVSGDATDPATIRRAAEGAAGPVVVFLALPPSVYAPVIEALTAAPLPPNSRVVVEKPFGTDLASAQQLNALLHEHFDESAVFRIDHFLGKQTVQSILGLRFANRLFEPLWCAAHIERVDIVWDETVTLEGRAGYYDRAGALRDMIQNHLLQLLTFVAMDRPAGLGEGPMRDAKADVLRSVRRPDPDDVRRDTVRGRYTAGTIGDRTVPDYVDEPGVDPSRATETFAEVTLFVDNDRWRDVPFRLRTGKALGANRRQIQIQFRAVDRLPFGQPDEPGPNIISLSMNPDRIAIDLALNGAGDPFCLDPARVDLALPPQPLSAYARLIADALDGDLSLAIRGDEAELAWSIVEPILDAWADGAVPLLPYAAGSDGPT